MGAMWLRQSTASQEIQIGMFVDDTDFKTAETALTIVNTDIKLFKHGATSQASKNSGGATHIANGWYYAVLDATDTNTLGLLEVTVNVSGALAVRREFMVLPAMIYDSIVLGTDRLDTNTTHINDVAATSVTTIAAVLGTTSAPTITSGRVNADLTHIAAAAVSTSTAQIGVNVVNFGGSAGTFASGRPAVNASYIGGVPVTATTSITFPTTCTVATTTGAVGSVTGAVGSVATGGIAATSFAAGAINAAAIATGAIDADALATDAVTEIWAGSTAPSAATIADAVWDEDATAHQTQGTFGQAIGDPAADTNTIYKAVVTDAIGATVGVDVGSVLDTVTNGGVVVASLAAGSITAAVIATGAIDADALAADAGTEIGTAVWASATRVLTAGTNVDGSTFTAIPWNAAWDAEVQSEVQDAIEVNHLDHLLAVTYDPASKPGAADALLNELVESDAGVARYTANALEQAPTGGSAPTASQIADEVQTRTIAGVTLVGTTTNLSNLPTIPANWLTAAGTAADFTTEIQSGLATAASIAALNNLSAAQVNAEVDTAIADARLDELLAADSDIDGAAPPAVGSVFHELMTKTTGSFTYDQTTDSLEAVRDRGDTTWTTATGFSTLDAAGVRTAVGLASANLDTQLGDLPTNAELSTALGTADDATLAAIAALNNLSAAQVNAEVDTALADYDAPTNAEMVARTLAAASYATAAAQSTAQTSLDDIPTNAELATALGTADDAVLAAIAVLQTYVDTEVAAIKAKTDNLPTDPADASDIAASFASIASSIATLQTYVDTEVAAIKAKTDSLTFGVANTVNANITYVNETAVGGTGATGDEWGPA